MRLRLLYVAAEFKLIKKIIIEHNQQTHLKDKSGLYLQYHQQLPLKDQNPEMA